MIPCFSELEAGEGKLRSADEIESECQKLMDEFGGWEKLYDFYF